MVKVRQIMTYSVRQPGIEENCVSYVCVHMKDATSY